VRQIKKALSDNGLEICFTMALNQPRQPRTAANAPYSPLLWMGGIFFLVALAIWKSTMIPMECLNGMLSSFELDSGRPFPTEGTSGSSTAKDPPPPPQDSSKATVMAMGTNYGLRDYRRFVGSLRKTGFSGHIILAVSPKIAKDSFRYLLEKNVTVHKVQYVNCSQPIKSNGDPSNHHDKEMVTCVHPYPNLKNRWGRFPLLRDYLLECTDCTGPVLVTDMRDAFFQRDPFGPEAPPVEGLQVFEEHYTIRTTNWLVSWPVGDCKKVTFDRPMLCSGTTVGTREAMLGYLQAMYDEMVEWMADPVCCCFETNGDDQSIHNYLFYGTNRFSGLSPRAVPNRMGLIHTVGAQGALIYQAHMDTKQAMLPEGRKDDAYHMEYDGINSTTNGNNGRRSWIGMQFGLTDNEGYFVNHNGERSFVVHQYDRLASPFDNWLDSNTDLLG
jgi:hypothetical protein